MSWLSSIFKKNNPQDNEQNPTNSPISEQDTAIQSTQILGTTQDAAEELIEKGNQLEDAGDIDAAISEYQAALEIYPDYWRAYLNIAIAHNLKNQPHIALENFEKAHAANPHTHLTSYNLARTILQISHDRQRAKDLLQSAIKIKPDFFEATVLLADIYAEDGENQAAVELTQKALEIKPAHPGAMQNLSNYLYATGEIDTSIKILEDIASHTPEGTVQSYETKLSLIQKKRERGQADEVSKELKEISNQYPTPTVINTNCLNLSFAANTDTAQILKEHQKAQDWFNKNSPLQNPEETKEQMQKRREELKGATASQKIKIGFLSSDYRAHAVAYFIEPLLTHLSQEKFEIFAYSNTQRHDQLTAQLKQLAPNWRDISKLDTIAATNLIRQDKIDVLIDLNGHTAYNRLDVLHQIPAPHIATWVGYLGTTGLDAVNYRIADAQTDPHQITQSQHIEKIIHIEKSQWCYLMQPQTPPVNELPALKNSYITFGSFNQCAKLSAECINNWAKIINKIENSKITFAAVPKGYARDRITNIFIQNDISEDRIKFLPRTDWLQYFQSYNEVDISLDSYPYNGATTTFDSLIMGVPVISLLGNKSVSRSGLSILTELGHPEWVAKNPEQLIEIAEKLSSDKQALAQIRAQLRGQMQKSSLTNGLDFAQRFEDTIMQMINS